MGYRNSFAPVIEGEVSDGGRFSRIQITMRPSIFAAIFLGFVCLIFLPVFMLMAPVVLVAVVAAHLQGDVSGVSPPSVAR